MPYAIDLTTEIDVPPSRVWRALCDPAEVILWDTTVDAALDAPADYPKLGQHVRWRCKGTKTLLHDHPQNVQPERRLHSLLAFGRQHLDETYTLTATPSGTRLDLHIDLTLTTPAIAPLLLRFIDGPAVQRAFEASLTNLKYYCELGGKV